MANHPSAEKRNRQRVKRTARNRNARSAVRTKIKNARAAIEAGEADAATASVADAERALANVAGRGILHKNTAARTTSRLRRALDKIAKA